ncbi:MAG: sodium:proton antiporter [Propionibacteriaceae bacterium]|jgi:CPA1 family monovalent cation:H+ antiporter|nr:sodium:proton antiporter [Propionibacteriaceae bacterium]
MELELVAIVGILLVVTATTLAPKIGVASPLLLVALGFGISMLPFVEPVSIPPELILTGILPPLLYAAAANTPVMEFRRDLGTISVFSVLLVALTAVAIGFLAVALVPGLPLGIGIALGAILSPTDAVATSIVRKAGVSKRIVTILEGESMLNDASALVLLRAAVASVGVGVSLWQVAGQFLWAVVGAVVIGLIVGRLNVVVRGRIRQVPANVALSLVVPFVAYIPAEEVGASGLVAAVVAGLATGYGAPLRMGAQVRIAERSVWSTIELILESAVFLLVGLELPTLAADTANGGLGLPAVLALLFGAVVLVVRTALVAWSLWTLGRRRVRLEPARERLEQMQAKIESGEVPAFAIPERRGRGSQRKSGRPAATPEERLGRWQWMVARRKADLDYLAAERLGWREGGVLVWAGMRGAVTIAAAQTLPADAPHRSLVILIATLVAVGTLVIQGLTLQPLARRLGLTEGNTTTDPAQWDALQAELDAAALADLVDSGNERAASLVEKMKARLDHTSEEPADDRPDASTFASLRLQVIEAQRAKLLKLRDVGNYPSSMMDDALAQLDAQQIGIELRQQYSE